MMLQRAIGESDMLITKTFTDGADAFLVRSNDGYRLTFLAGDDLLRVEAGTVTAHMGMGNDRVVVGGGSATIFGDEGQDRFDLRSAATIDGGADNDRFNLWGGSNHVLAGGTGNDGFAYYGSVTGEIVSGGAGNDRFFGNGFAIHGQFSGGEGNDAFYGFDNPAGGVTLAGGAGNDLYRVLDAAGPVIVENAGEGTDTVQVARGLSYTLGEAIENLRVLDSAGSGDGANLVGNELRNLITGSSGRDTIKGLGGNDVLIAGAGNDQIDGGTGRDRIVGGLGSDLLLGGAGADIFAYLSVAESNVASWDQIDDFDLTVDRIDLSAIDADTTTPGKQDFIWGGTGVGHLVTGAFIGTDLVADTDGDGRYDFYIYLPTVPEGQTLTADNFIL
jgi:Ca2+-binding RTX toxin-like protein